MGTVDFSEQKRTNRKRREVKKRKISEEKRRKKRWQLTRERILMWRQWSGMTSSTIHSSRTGGRTLTSPCPPGTRLSTGRFQVRVKITPKMRVSLSVLQGLCCLLACILIARHSQSNYLKLCGNLKSP